MLPSSTVENYLKAIYLGVGALTPGQRLLPMGQLASSLGVAPGTARSRLFYAMRALRAALDADARPVAREVAL